MVYVHTDIQWEETSVLSFFLFCLSQSKGNAFHRKEELTVHRSKCCAVKYLLFLHLVHLVPPPLSSSWLVTSKQEEKSKQLEGRGRLQQEKQAVDRVVFIWCRVCVQ